MEEKKVYTEEELEEIRGWVLDREQFKEEGHLPNYKPLSALFGGSLGLGLIAEWWCLIPGVGIFWLVNNFSNDFFKQYSFWSNPRFTEAGQMFLPISVLIVFFAILGIASIFAWIALLSGGDNKEEWYKKEIEKSEKMCEAALQEAERPLREEIDDLKSQLAVAQCNERVAKTEKETLDKLLAEQEAEYKKDINLLKETYLREKRLLNLELRELRFQLKAAKRVEDDEEPIDSL